MVLLHLQCLLLRLPLNPQLFPLCTLEPDLHFSLLRRCIEIVSGTVPTLHCCRAMCSVLLLLLLLLLRLVLLLLLLLRILLLLLLLVLSLLLLLLLLILLLLLVELLLLLLLLVELLLLLLLLLLHLIGLTLATSSKSRRLLLLLLLLLVLLLLLWFPFKLLRLLPAVLRRTGAVRVYSCHVHSASSTRCFHLGLQVLGMYFQLFKLLQRACEFLVHIQGDGGLKFELHLCQELCNILRPVDQHLARFSDLLPLGIQLILWQGKFVDA